MILALLLIATYAGHGVLSVWSFVQLRRFLGQTPEIADEACLGRYKTLVRAQMYIALVGIVVLVGGFIVGLVLMKRYGCFGIILVMAGSAYLLGAGLFMRKWEVRARGLSARPDLAEEYRRVSEAWVKKPLPDF